MLGQISNGKTGTPKGMDVDSCPNDVSTTKRLSCMVVKGLHGDVDVDPNKLPLISGLQIARCFVADTGESWHITSGRHDLHDYKPTD